MTDLLLDYPAISLDTVIIVGIDRDIGLCPEA